MSEAPPSQIDDPDRLAEVAASGLLDTPPEPEFDDLAGLAARLLRAPFAFVTIVDGQRSYWKARIGVPEGGATQNTAEESFCQYVVNSGEALIEGDVRANPLTSDNPSIATMGVRAWAGFPLVAPGGRPLGSFCVVDTVEREWTEEDVETLRVLSTMAGREVALRSIVTQSGAAAQHLGVLAAAGQTLASTLDAHEAVARLADLVVPHLGDWSLVSLADATGRLTDVGWRHVDARLDPLLERLAGSRHIGVEDGATNRTQRSGQPEIVNANALEIGLRVLTSEQARAALTELAPDIYGIWPLSSGNAVHGTLVIARDRGRPPFTRAEADLAAGIADRAGSVLENASLYDHQSRISADLEVANARLRETGRHDSDVARALQEAMLSRLPEPDGIELAARYLTADDHDKVGGDWYDVVAPPGGAITLVIGDVAGHDIGAASVMGQLRNLLRALAWEHDDELPGALLTRLDRAMADLGLPTMATVLVARVERAPISPTSRLHQVRWSSAGHPAPVLIDQTGGPQFLQGAPDPPLAAAPGVSRTDHSAVLGQGETLLLYTDGLVETRTDAIDQRFGQLLEVLRSTTGASLERTLDIAVAGMLDGSREDDVALIAARLPELS